MKMGILNVLLHILYTTTLQGYSKDMPWWQGSGLSDFISKKMVCVNIDVTMITL